MVYTQLTCWSKTVAEMQKLIIMRHQPNQNKVRKRTTSQREELIQREIAIDWFSPKCTCRAGLSVQGFQMGNPNNRANPQNENEFTQKSKRILRQFFLLRRPCVFSDCGSFGWDWDEFDMNGVGWKKILRKIQACFASEWANTLIIRDFILFVPTLKSVTFNSGSKN